MNPKHMVLVCADKSKSYLGWVEKQTWVVVSIVLFLTFLTMENYSMARSIELQFQNSDHMDISSTSTIYLGQVTWFLPWSHPWSENYDSIYPWGQQDGSARKGFCCQVWLPELDPWNPHSGKRELTLKLSPDFHTYHDTCSPPINKE